MIKIKEYKKMGRGVMTTQGIKKHQVVMKVDTIVIPKHQAKHVHNTILDNYVYDSGDGLSLVALGLGSLFNHSSSPSIGYVVKRLNNGRYIIIYKALRNIKANEQLFIDYGYNPE